MNTSLTSVGAILRKDGLLLWPLALATAILLTAYVALGQADLPSAPAWFQPLLAISANVACALAIVSVIQADAPASIRHDWLTRPVPRSVLFVAKAIFVVALVLLPSILGEVIAGLREGRSWDEIAFTATGIQWSTLVMVLAASVLAAFTATKLEAAVIGIVIIAVTLFSVPLMLVLAKTGEEINISGAAWLAEEPRTLFAFGMSCALLWLTYAQRRTSLARVLFVAAAVLLIVSPVLMPWPTIFAIQKQLSPEPRAADAVVVARDGTCFPAIVVNPPASASTSSAIEQVHAPGGAMNAVLTASLWSMPERREAAANAIGFETPTAITGAPSGWRTLIERVDGAYIGPDGRVVRALRPARYTPVLRRVDTSMQLVSHFWLLPRAEFERLKNQPVRLALNYALSVLSPAASAEIAVDGTRRYLPGFGHCGAQFDVASNSIEVDCFMRGEQPAQLTANRVGGSADTETASGYPDYRPAALELLASRRHIITLRDVAREEASRVRLVRYEARAHFNREVIVDGLLGAAPDACPAPQLQPKSEGPSL